MIDHNQWLYVQDGELDRSADTRELQQSVGREMHVFVAHIDICVL